MESPGSLREEGPAIVLDTTVALSPTAPRDARRLLADAMPNLPGRELEAAQLLITETIAEGMRHSNLPERTPIHVRLSCDPRRLRVTVEAPGWRVVAPAATLWDEDSSEIGMLVLSYLADRWGVEGGTDAPTVWFELDLR
jgi:hypothetical protein